MRPHLKERGSQDILLGFCSFQKLGLKSPASLGVNIPLSRFWSTTPAVFVALINKPTLSLLLFLLSPPKSFLNYVPPSLGIFQNSGTFLFSLFFRTPFFKFVFKRVFCVSSKQKNVKLRGETWTLKECVSVDCGSHVILIGLLNKNRWW